MSVPVEFHRLALEELKVAKRWYEARSDTASDRFVQQVERAIARIAENPETLPELAHGYRRIHLHYFPYHVVFQLQPNGAARIIAVAHDRRRPECWRRRN